MPWETFSETFLGYWRYLGREVTHPHAYSYVWWLIAVSMFFLLWEAVAPWRKQKPLVHRDFWLDGFYMFFNFFLFPALGYAAAAAVVELGFLGALRRLFGIESLALLEVDDLPTWAYIIVLFVARDFIQWNIHRLLHRVPWLWSFHKVHHSAEELGFATHLRFHWMETVAYRTLEYMPLALLGYGAIDLFAMHIVALFIGHWNHANIRVPLGPLKYILNNPQMHRWHHALGLPRKYGVNFGLSLSLWDYVFGTAYIPRDGADATLGIDDEPEFPREFLQQLAFPPGSRGSRTQGR